MLKCGTAYPTSRRNFLLITFNWVANALVSHHYIFVKLMLNLFVCLLMNWYPTVVNFSFFIISCQMSKGI